jgi:hypothetical protein
LYDDGQSRITIRVKEVTPGQLVFGVIKGRKSGKNVSIALGSAVLDWTRDHPKAEVVSTLPIVTNGVTVAVHLWYVNK